ncbi:MAG: chemotaxis protein CheX [Planctomycetales bacterium]|nr:chemotaxis protein CheX [Planctomycetales bacterium]
MDHASALLNEVLQRNKTSDDQSDSASQPTENDNVNERLFGATRGAVSKVLKSMCGWDITARESRPVVHREKRFEISGIISISGACRVTLVINVERELAFAMAEEMIGCRPEQIDADTLDLVGEMANMIGGKAKELVGIDGMALGLPTVVSGEGHVVAFDSEASLHLLPFECEHGRLNVEFAGI